VEAHIRDRTVFTNFFFITHDWTPKARLFVHGRLFQCGLAFACGAGAYPTVEHLPRTSPLFRGSSLIG